MKGLKWRSTLLSLDSVRWKELKHAYGSAANIPGLLKQLDGLPDSSNNKEPWFSLWSALAHQGGVYSASFAAVPYVIEALSTSPESAEFSYFLFPAIVEIGRRKHALAVPADLEKSYFASLSRLPSLVASASVREWDANFLACALSAIAVSKGQSLVAEAVLELNPDVAVEFMEWFHEH
jgi:hypothetical protein